MNELSDQPAPTRPGCLSLLMIGVGASAALLGGVGGLVFILVTLLGQKSADPVTTATLGLSMMGLGIGLGGSLAWSGYRAARGLPSPPFKPGRDRLWLFLALWIAAVLLGQGLLTLGWPLTVIFPPLHLVAVAAPAVGMIALIGYGLRQANVLPTRRQVLGQLTFGAFFVTTVSILIEAVVAVVFLFGVGVMLALAPGGMEDIARLTALLDDPTQIQSLDVLTDWLLRPVVILAVVIFLTVVTPVVEELVKGLAVPAGSLVQTRRDPEGKWEWVRPSPAQGWLWGIAAGVGFGLTEGIFNSATNLDMWAAIVLLRVGTMIMHAVTAGLTGLGWARSLETRRPWPLLGRFAVSVGLHSVWNALAVLIFFLSMWTAAGPAVGSRQLITGIGTAIGLFGLATHLAASMVLTVVTTRRVAAAGSPDEVPAA